jgi:hypothetical protein
MKNFSTDVQNAFYAGIPLADYTLVLEFAKAVESKPYQLAGVLARYLTAEQMRDLIAYSNTEIVL